MHGVAGENDNVHDHWVDGFGNDVIWDFSRSEGDRILIEGHTTEVYHLEHRDSDGDGILDSTVLHVWSNQGNGGGAHNKDLLGTITVFGDLVMESDYEVNKTDYGIVENISQLDEALTPRVYTSVADDGSPPPTPPVDDGELPPDGVFGMLDQVEFSGEHGNHIEVTHSANMELNEGTIALNFTADNASGWTALFSKDYTGNRDGGDLTAFVADGRVKVRFQSATHDVWLKSAEGSVRNGQEYHLALTFGDDGFWLYLDGQMVDGEAEFTQSLQQNTQNMAIGANTWSRNADRPNKTWDNFDGRISDFVIYDTQYDSDAVQQLDGNYQTYTQDGFTLVYRGKVLYVHGTEDNNKFFWSADEPMTFSVDRIDFTILDGTKRIQFLESDGYDSIRMIGSSGDDMLHSRPERSVFTTSVMQVTANNFQQVIVDAGEGANDAAYMYDSDGNDVFSARPDSAFMRADWYDNRAEGFDRVVGYSSTSGDRAYMYDSSQNDILVVRPDSITMQSDDFENRAMGFGRTFSLARSGGDDMAHVYDSEGDDVLNGDANQIRHTGDGFNNYISGFGSLQTHDSGGAGHDRLYLKDSAGDDQVELGPGYAYLSNADTQMWINGFEYQRLLSVFGGNDSVQLNDSDGADMLVSHANYTSMAGEHYRNLAIGFGDVRALASSLDPNDQVIIYGSDDADQIEFDDDYGSFVSASSSRYFQGFGWALAYIDSANDDVTEGSVRYHLRIVDQ